MVCFSEIQQFPDFLELFPGNFRTICARFENFGTFGQVVSALYHFARLLQGARVIRNTNRSCVFFKGLQV